MHSVQFYFLETSFEAVVKTTHEISKTIYHVHFLEQEVRDLLGERFEFSYENNNLITVTERTAVNQRLLDFFYDQIMLYRIQQSARPAIQLQKVK